ncbi:MAG: permease-like cell division protein FtsX [Clostridiales bacterium]|nr:permease-like cell division protein FtsX [Clostridiales bacterium]
MKLSKFKYSFSEAKKNVSRNGLMSIASLFTIACCLIILGVFAILSLNVNSITDQIKDQCEVQLYISAGTAAERVEAIGNEIRAIDNVKEATLFTKEETLAYAKNDMFEGKEELLDGFDEDNPFSDSYKIILTDIEKTDETVEALSQIRDVEKVVNKQDVVNIVLSVSDLMKKFSIAVMIVLLIVAIVIISNTVKLTVFNRRKEINIMKYIGATDRFIRVPFVLEGLIIGFLGAVFAFLVVFWGYFALLKYMNGLSFNIFKLVGLWEVAPIVGILFLIFGCLIGVSGSAISMRKYLHV